jgi:hypothetical protein
MSSASAGRQVLAATDQFTARAQVEPAVEANFGSSWVNTQQRRIPNRGPDTHARRLQVHAGFILTQNDRVRRVLGHINQFFSALAWNSAISRSRRDLYTFSMRC